VDVAPLQSIAAAMTAPWALPRPVVVAVLLAERWERVVQPPLGVVGARMAALLMERVAPVGSWTLKVAVLLLGALLRGVLTPPDLASLALLHRHHHAALRRLHHPLAARHQQDQLRHTAQTTKRVFSNALLFLPVSIRKRAITYGPIPGSGYCLSSKRPKLYLLRSFLQSCGRILPIVNRLKLGFRDNSKSLYTAQSTVCHLG
jgi:hypothetical protein